MFFNLDFIGDLFRKTSHIYLFFSILHGLQLFYTYKLQFILLLHADPLTKVVENCLSKARN